MQRIVWCVSSAIVIWIRGGCGVKKVIQYHVPKDERVLLGNCVWWFIIMKCCGHLERRPTLQISLTTWLRRRMHWSCSISCQIWKQFPNTPWFHNTGLTLLPSENSPRVSDRNQQEVAFWWNPCLWLLRSSINYIEAAKKRWIFLSILAL